MEPKSFQDVIVEIRGLITKFQSIEQKDWSVEAMVVELAKQVGQLAALVMNRENNYFRGREIADQTYAATDEKIGDELADILLVLVRIADAYGIDLEKANFKARQQEHIYFQSTRNDLNIL